MKLKPNFIVRQIASDTVVMDINDTGRLLRLDETAADILRLLQEGNDKTGIAAKLTELYEIDLPTAEADVARILETLVSLGALED